MKTQISRNSRQPKKRYSGVYQQQGRMFTDSDINEQVDLTKAYLAQVLGDIVGSGTPRKHALSITEKAHIQPGGVYVNGTFAQVLGDDPIPYEKQSDFPEAPKISEEKYLFYADVWQRTVLALEDDNLRDVALHGADTCSRTQTMVQIKWCPESHHELLPQLPPKGLTPLSISLREITEDSGTDCDPCADLVNLDASIGNYLFRLEVHRVEYDEKGIAEKITLKWSNENGAEQYRIGEEPLDFSSGQWVYEYCNDTTEKHLGIHLTPDQNALLTGALTETYSKHQPDYHYVRRWDGYLVLERKGSKWQASKKEGTLQGLDKGVRLKTTGSLQALGRLKIDDHLRINLSDVLLELELLEEQPFALVAGDYWSVALRQHGDYPDNIVMAKQLPEGVDHHYLPLAKVEGDKAIMLTGEDCRTFGFPSLTDINAADVCYEHDCEHLYGNASTVKQALDNLCNELDASDIPFNNQCNKLYQSATTVQQALDNLCGIEATDIALDSDCSMLSSANTVAEGMDILCRNSGSGGGCAITVGEGGQYPTLDQVFAELTEQATLVLCLLPGEHVLKQQPQQRFTTLKITGSGAASSTIVVDSSIKQLQLSAGECILRDLAMEVKAKSGQVILSAEAVDVQGCVFERLSSVESAESLLFIGGDHDTMLTWENNAMTSVWRKPAKVNEWLDVLKPDGAAIDAIDMDKFKDLAAIDPVKSPQVYEKALKDVSKTLTEIPATKRKVWAKKRNTTTVKNLENLRIRRLDVFRPISLGAKARAAKGRYKITDSSKGVKDNVNDFYKELAKTNVNDNSIRVVLDDTIRTLAMGDTGFGRCLGLADHSVSGTVRDNLFDGSLVLNEVRSNGADLGTEPFSRVHPELDTPLHPDSEGTLRITGNHCQKVITLLEKKAIANSRLSKAIETWRSVTVSDNVFTESQNSIAGYSVTYQGNHFDINPNDSTGSAAMTLSFYVAYTANTGNNDLVLKNSAVRKVEAANTLTIV